MMSMIRTTALRRRVRHDPRRGPAARRDPHEQLHFVLSVALPILAAALLASLAALACVLRRGAAAAEGEEEALLRRTVARLRERLLLTRKHGFYLSTERPPSTGWLTMGGSRAPPICLRTAHVEALARLELLADFDSLLVDAMCSCLSGDGPLQQPLSRSCPSMMDFAAEPGCSPQQAALRAWLLGLARELLDPTTDAEQPAQREVLSWWKTGSMRLSSSGATGPCQASASASLTSGSIRHGGLSPVLTRASSAKARFVYLESKVSNEAWTNKMAGRTLTTLYFAVRARTCHRVGP
jgi:hypothetical protein